MLPRLQKRLLLNTPKIFRILLKIESYVIRHPKFEIFHSFEFKLTEMGK